MEAIGNAALGNGDMKGLIDNVAPRGTDAAPFDLTATFTEVCEIACTIKVVWDVVGGAVDSIELADKLFSILDDDNKKLELAERVVQHLRQLGFSVTAARVEDWIDKLLDYRTRAGQRVPSRPDGN
jgi:hypothetical protein